MATETLSTKLSTRLPPVIDHNIVQMTVAEDRFVEEWTRTAEGVFNPDTIGRSWQAIVPVLVPQVAGAIEYGAVDQSGAYSDPTYTGPGWVPEQVESYPGLDKMSLVGTDDFTITLKKVKLNFGLPAELFHAQTLSAIAGNVIKDNVDGVVRLAALTDLYSMYVDATNNTLADISSVAFSSSNRIATFTASSGPSFRFIRGQFVDVYDSTGTTKRNANFKLRVKRVNHKTGAVVIADPTGANDLSAAGIINTDIVVSRASKGNLPFGLNSFIKSSGTVCGLAISDYPEIGSYERSLSGATFTEAVWLEVAGRWFKEYGDHRLVGVATPEIINKHLEEFGAVTGFSSPSVFQRQGTALDRVAGTKNVVLKLQYGTKQVDVHGSAYQQAQTMHFANADPGNLRIYSPPRVDEFGMHPDFPQLVHFILGFGGNSIFGNAPYAVPGGQVEATNWFHAPCHAIYERFMRMPAGIKFTSVGHLSNKYS